MQRRTATTVQTALYTPLLLVLAVACNGAGEPTATTPQAAAAATGAAPAGAAGGAVEVVTDASALPPAERRVLRHLATAARELPAADSPAADGPVPGELRAAAEQAEAGGLDALAAYLRAVAAAIGGEAPAAAAERLRRAIDGGDLVVALIPAPDDREPTWALRAGVRDPAEQRWVEPWLAGLAEFESWLPAPPRAAASAVPASRIVIARPAVQGGAAAGSCSASTFLPAARELADEIGRDYLFWKDLAARCWYAGEVAPSAPLVLVPEQARLATAGAHLRFYATRFSTYQLGPQTSPAGDGRRLGLRQRFGEQWGPTVIAKADLLGVLAHEWLIERGLRPADESDENLAMLVVMAFRAWRDSEAGEAPPGHAPASRLEIRRLRRSGALTWEPDSDRWRLDLPRARQAVRELAREILDVHARGDVEAARALLAPPPDGDPPEVRATLDRLAAIGDAGTTATVRVRGLGEG